MWRILAWVALLAVTGVVIFAFTSPTVVDVAAEPSAPEPTSVTATTTPTPTESTTPPPPELRVAPTLVDLDGWLQSDVDDLESLQGRVVILQFWTFGCRNCKNTLPTLQSLYADYHDDGLEIVGVHSPEFSYEAEVANIEEALVNLEVPWRVALDTDKRNFHAWQEGTTAYWPRTYVIDKSGLIRYDHIGEGGYDDLRQTVEFLLATEH